MKTEIKVKVTPNYNKRTYTIKEYINGKLFAKYRTYKMNRKEFDSSEFDTENDWKYFLNHTNDYYLVQDNNVRNKF